MPIVGVAPARASRSVRDASPKQHIYLPSGASVSTRMFVFARAAAPQTPTRLLATVRQQLQSADANLPVIFVKSFRIATRRQRACLDPAGRGPVVPDARPRGRLRRRDRPLRRAQLPGVAPHARVRRAHGGRRLAGRRDAAGLARSGRHDAVGLAIGLGLGVLLGWGLSAVIYQVSPFDPITLGGATGILASHRSSRRSCRRAGGGREFSPSDGVHATS